MLFLSYLKSWLSNPGIQIMLNSYNPSHTIMTFNIPIVESFKKTLKEKEKMLVTSIFSCSHNVFRPSRIIFKFPVTFVLSSAMPSIWTSLQFCCFVRHLSFTKYSTDFTTLRKTAF